MEPVCILMRVSSPGAADARRAPRRLFRVRRPCELARSVVLALAIAATAAPGADARESRDSLTKDLRAAYQARAWPEAVVVARRIVALDPKLPGGWYNLACMQARAGSREEAVASLRESAARGFDLVATLTRDEDLDSIRKAPGFAEAATAVWSNGARSLAAFRERAEKIAVLRVSRPRGVDRAAPAPLLIALHGRGGDALTFQRALAPVARELGAILAVPQGMEELEGGGFGWGRLEEGEYLTERAIERAEKDAQARVDRGRVVVLGFSQGGATAIAAALRHPDRVRGAVIVGMGDDPRVYPVPDVPRAGLPGFAVLVGSEDRFADEARYLAERLAKAGVRSALRVEPGLGHDLPRDRVRVLAGAVRFALGEREELPE